MTRFLFWNLKGRWLLVSVGIALTFVAVGTDILMAFPLKYILDKIVHHSDPNLAFFGSLMSWFDQFGTRNGLNDTEQHTQLGVILFAGAMALTLGIIGAVVSFIQLAIAAFVAQDTGAKLRNRLFHHLEHLPLEWHGRQRVGDTVQRISGNIPDIEKLITDGLIDLLSGVLTLIGIVLVMFLLNWQFALLSMVIAPPLALVVVGFTRTIKRASRQTAKAAGQVAEVANEGVGAIVDVKAFNLEGWLGSTFADRVERKRSSGWRAGRLQAEFNPLVLTLVAVSTVVIITAGAWLAAGHGHQYGIWFLTIPSASLTIGSLTVFLAYSKMMYQPMRSLSKLMLLATTGASAAERIQEILDQPLEEKASAEQYTGPTTVRGSVVYKGVVFGYEENRPALQSIDLEVPVGKRVALVGLSGSGKTTLVRLLPRFYEPWSGTITIDGVDIRAYPRDVLRRNIGMVLQDAVLFEGTIRENLVLDREDATDAEIVTAAKQACIHDTIMNTPGGYNAQVREHGKNFSSGQRQRIAIARAILRDAPILILDEPTANLDVEAEAEVMRAIEQLTQGRTVIVISHRLSTLGHVDEIAVLDAGRIVERGTYQELKAKPGAFAHLLAEQNRYAAEPTALEPVHAPAPASNGHEQVRVATVRGHHVPRVAVPHRPSPRSQQAGLRLLIYTRDEPGHGHPDRARSLAVELLQRAPGASILAISDSPVGTLLRDHPNHDFLELPSCVEAAPGDSHSIFLPLDNETLRDRGGRLILEAAIAFCPDVLLIDHLPDGAMGELTPALNALKGSRTRIVLGVRHIIDAPELMRRRWPLDPNAGVFAPRTIDQLTKGRTAIVISHRVSTLGHIEEIAVLESGSMVGRGTYQELTANGGAYAHLIAAEFRDAPRPIAGALTPVLRSTPTGNGHEPAPVLPGQNGPLSARWDATGSATVMNAKPSAVSSKPGGLRLLTYTQDGRGLGHLRRASSLAAEFLRIAPGASVLTISDSPLGTLLRDHPNHDYLKLPSIVKSGPGDWHPLSLPLDYADLREMRSRLILDAATAFRPDVLLVDHMPHGAMGELMPTLEAFSESPTRIVLGVRDIIDAPDVVQQRWRVEGAVEALERHYDQVLVFGARDVFDVHQEYQWPARLAHLVRYCGYVCTPDAPSDAKRIRARRLAGVPHGKVIVAMAGGGADAHELMSTLLDALPMVSGAQPCVLELVTGPFMPEHQRQELKRRAEGLPVRLRTMVRDPLSYVAAADLVVGMAGYNTTMEVLRLGTPALLVPRRGPSSEQRMRARFFAARGWVWQLDPDELTPVRLALSVLEALSTELPARTHSGPDLGGLTRAVEHLRSAAVAARGDRSAADMQTERLTDACLPEVAVRGAAAWA